MTQQLIDGLLTAADWIETGKVDYAWGCSESCNCGVLAQVITGLPADEIYTTESTWSKEAIRVCDLTGLPLNEIVKTLIKAGMTKTDFINLEFLVDDGKVPDEWWYDDPRSAYYAQKENVVKYMRDWAARLQENLTNLPK